MSKTTAGPPGGRRAVAAAPGPVGRGRPRVPVQARKTSLLGWSPLPAERNPPSGGGAGPPEVSRWTWNAERRRHGGGRGTRPRPDAATSIPVALGRRVEVIGDLLLPAEPTDSSRGRLPGHRPAAGGLAGSGHRGPLRPPRGAGLPARRPTGRGAAPPRRADRRARRLRRPPRLAGRRRAGARPSATPSWCRLLEASGVAGARRGRPRAARPAPGPAPCWCAPASLRPDANPPIDADAERRPALAGRAWSASTTRGWRAASSPPGCSTAACAATSGRRRWCWRRSRLLLRVEFVVDGLGRVFRSPRQQTALQRAYDATWASRLRRHRGHRRRAPGRPRAGGRHHLARHLAGPRRRGPARRRGPVGRPGIRAHRARPARRSTGRTRSTPPAPPSRPARPGVIAGGALVPELTHLDAGFFACPGASAEVVHEHRGRLGLPPTFLHHRQESTLEIETGADLHVRLLLAEADLPMATLGERLVTPDTVVKGHSKAAEVHAELAAGWPSGPSWPPAPEVAADRIRVRRIRRLAAVSLFVAGAIDLLSSVTTPLREHLHLIAQYLPIAVVQAAGALTAIAGIGMIMLSRGILRGQRRSWLVAVALLVASLALHLVHAADLITLVVCAGVLILLVVQRERFRAQTEPATIVTAFVILAIGGVIATLGGFVGGRGGRPRAPPPAPRLARRAARLGRTARRRAVGRLPAHHRPLRLDQPAGRRHQPHRGRALPVDPAGRRPPAVVGPGLHGPARRRAAGPRHRAPPRHGHARLLRAARRQAVVLPPRLARRLRRLRRGLPGLARPHRPVLRAGARLGLVPPLRGPQRLGPGRHGRRRGMAAHLPGLGHALPLHRRRGGGGPARPSRSRAGR